MRNPVVLLLLIYCFVVGPRFVMQYLVFFLVLLVKRELLVALLVT